MMAKSIPTLDFEQTLLKAGYRHIGGADEAGRGSLFGPVCVGLAVLPLHMETAQLLERLKDIRDSKQLVRQRVYELAEVVKAEAVAWAVGVASSQEIDRYSIIGGIRLALHRAFDTISTTQALDYLLADRNMPVQRLPIDSQTITRGDALCLSIACGAILAKHQHDLLVRDLASKYDAAYDLMNNVGYGTANHMQAIRNLGATPDHRYSFKPIGQPRLFE